MRALVVAGLVLALAGAARSAGPDQQTGVSVATREARALSAPQEEQFQAAYDGSLQKYLLLLPGDFDRRVPHDLLMALHGHGSDRNQYAKDPRGECAGARDVAAAHEMIFVSPDYRGTTSWMGPAGEADVVQLLSELKKTFKVRRVYLVGGSMGGTAVLTFAALHPELVDGVSSQNGMANLLEYTYNGSNIQDAIKNSFGGRKDESPAAYKKRDPAEYLKRSAELHPEKFTMPLAITVGGLDTAVPPESVLRLAAAVKKKNPQVLVIDRPETGHSTNYQDTVTALEFVIDAAEKAGGARRTK